jgi:hypothetical protein
MFFRESEQKTAVSGVSAAVTYRFQSLVFADRLSEGVVNGVSII